MKNLNLEVFHTLDLSACQSRQMGAFMEIERKFLIPVLPENLKSFPFHQIEQGYLCTNPVVRIRRQDDAYYLTYKSKGHMMREEYNLPLTSEAYGKLRTKIDGILITKKRYLIPYEDTFTIELDIFEGSLAPLLLAEVEFESEESANAFTPPDWFGEDVTFSGKYQNSILSQDASSYVTGQYVDMDGGTSII